MSQSQLQPRTLTRNGVADLDGTPRLYGGDPDLVHVADGKRASAGRWLATQLDQQMRLHAEDRTFAERAEQLLCPGCYMVVGFNMLVCLAQRNHQPLAELALSMSAAFAELAAGGPSSIEHIAVVLDPAEEGSAN